MLNANASANPFLDAFPTDSPQKLTQLHISRPLGLEPRAQTPRTPESRKLSLLESSSSILEPELAIYIICL